MLECPKCKYDNDLGRIFCAKCGEKLDIHKIGAPTSVRQRTRRGSKNVPLSKATGLFLLKILNVTLLACVSAFIISIASSPNFDIPSVGDDNLISFHEKRLQMEAAVSGAEATQVVFQEGDLNAPLAEALRTALKENENAGGFQLERVFVKLNEGQVTVFVQNKWKWFRMYLQLDAQPVSTNGKWTFKTTGARIGKFHIPKIDFLLDAMGSFFSAFWRDLDQEKQWLGDMADVQIHPGKMVLVSRGGGS